MRRTLRKWLGSRGVQATLNATLRPLLAWLGLADWVARWQSHALRTLLVPRHIHLKLGKTRPYTRRGLRWLLDPGEYDQWKLWAGNTEHVLAPVLASVNPSQPTLLLDIGANIGQISLPLAQWAAQHALAPSAFSIWAFEPHPVLRSRFEANLAANPRLESYITLQPYALGDAPGTVKLHSPDPRHMGLTHVGGTPTEDAPTAAVVRLDDVLPTELLRGKRVVMKMDVEGFELAVLKGAPRLLAQHPPLILEVGDESLRRAGTSAWGLVQWLKSTGYSSFATVPECADVSGWQQTDWNGVFLNLLVQKG